MSIWTRPLFSTGKTPLGPLISESAKRCARLRISNFHRFFRALLLLSVAIALFQAVFWFGLMWWIEQAAPPRPPGAKLEPPFWRQFVERQQLIQWSAVLLVAGLILWLGPLIAQQILDSQLDKTTLSKSRKQRWKWKWSRRVVVMAWVFNAALLAAAWIFMSITTQWQIGLLVPAKAGIIVAPFLLAAGLTHRSGRGIVCGRCSYPMISWRAAAPVCPECGLEWRRPWRHRWGVPHIKWRWVFGGMLLPLACAAIVTMVFRALMP